MQCEKRRAIGLSTSRLSLNRSPTGAEQAAEPRNPLPNSLTHSAAQPESRLHTAFFVLILSKVNASHAQCSLLLWTSSLPNRVPNKIHVTCGGRAENRETQFPKPLSDLLSSAKRIGSLVHMKPQKMAIR